MKLKKQAEELALFENKKTTVKQFNSFPRWLIDG